MHPPTANAADHALDRIFDLGAGGRHRTTISIALAAALLAHGGVAGALRLRGERLAALGNDLDAQELAIDEEEEAKPAPIPEPLPPEPLPPEPPKIDPHVVEQVIAPAPPPEEPIDEPPSSEAAQAGQVLVQEDDAEEEEDETDETDDNTFVVGTGEDYAGGMTAAGGTRAIAVHGTVVDVGGVPGGRGTAVVEPPKPAEPDLSRRAWLDGNTSWDCDFPGEADRDRVDSAIVGMMVDVSASGKAIAVRIVDDPGHGFARMASACALNHKFAPALDAKGKPIDGTTLTFHIGFHR